MRRLRQRLPAVLRSGDERLTSYTFDSFECAIQKLAPTCAHCGCRILGHGIEEADTVLLLLRALRQAVRSGRRARQRGRPASIDPGR